jgi:hypothetical protein
MELDNKAVSIAKDVIEHINSGKFLPTDKIYIKMHNGTANDDNLFGDNFPNKYGYHFNDAVYELLKRPCEVCALGAMIMSAVNNYGTSVTTMDARKLYNVLEPHFNIKDLALIEVAFEGAINGIISDSYRQRFREWRAVGDDECGFNHNTSISFAEVAAALAFYRKHKDSAQERMRLIMQNIIENNEFNLWKLDS